MRFEREDLTIEGGRKLYLYTFPDFEENAKKQAKLWGSVGDAWQREAAQVEEWFAPVTQAMNAALPSASGVLVDVGCGAMTMPFPSGWRGVGIDVAPEMLPHVVGDESRLPVLSQSVDAVTGRFSYMFSVSPAESFAEAYRCLKPGGVFVFSTWASAEQNQWASVPMDYLCDRLGLKGPSKDEPHAFRLADRDEASRLLTSAGFSASAEAAGVEYMKGLLPADALDFVLGLAGPIKLAFERIPVDEQPRARAELEGLAGRMDWKGRADVWAAKKMVDKPQII